MTQKQKASYEEVYVERMNSYRIILDKFTTEEGLKFYLGSLRSLHCFFFIYYWFVRRDLYEAKRHLYLAGRLFEFSLTQPSDYHHIHFAPMANVILSDEPNIIHRIANLQHNGMVRPIQRGDGFDFQAFQFILKEDWASLQALVERMDTKMLVQKQWQFALWDREVFVGFLERDKAKIENALKEMLVPKVHKARNKHQIYPECVSFPALGYAKLAWMQGMEVAVNNPLVPQELLPVQPLAVYPEYEFILAEEAKTPLTK